MAFPQPPQQRVALSAGIPTANKILVFVMTGLAIIALLFLALVASALGRSSGTTGVLGPTLIGVFAVVAAVALVWGIASVVRVGAFVEGTELVVRKAFTEQRVDLATAQRLQLTDANQTVQSFMLPVLGAYGDAQGRSATVVFRRTANGFIPGHEVEALTAAIRSGHRTGPVAELADQVLKDLATRALTPT